MIHIKEIDNPIFTPFITESLQSNLGSICCLTINEYPIQNIINCGRMSKSPFTFLSMNIKNGFIMSKNNAMSIKDINNGN